MCAGESRRQDGRVEQVRQKMLLSLCNVVLRVVNVGREHLRRVLQSSQQDFLEIAGNVHGT